MRLSVSTFLASKPVEAHRSFCRSRPFLAVVPHHRIIRINDATRLDENRNAGVLIFATLASNRTDGHALTGRLVFEHRLDGSRSGEAVVFVDAIGTVVRRELPLTWNPKTIR